MKTFLKQTEVELINGGYLSDKEGNPVNHPEFVTAQLEADYIVKFAELAKGKNFEGTKADSLADVKSAVLAELAKKDVSYVEAGPEPKSTVGDKLSKEALDFHKFQEKLSSTGKINTFLQKFNVINDFEVNGLFFEQDVVKLNKIYTIKEVTEAVSQVIDLV